MIDPRALLPHERPCPNPSCEDGRVQIYKVGRHELLATGQFVRCEICDGTQVVLREDRRSTPRVAMDDEITRLVNIVTASRDDWRAEAVRLVRENGRLRRENLRMREAVHTAASTIERNQLRPSPSASTPMDTRAADGGGLHSSKEVQ